MSKIIHSEQEFVPFDGHGAGRDGANAPALIEEREAPRVTLDIRSAKLTCDVGDFVCVIRDVSATGVSLRSFYPIPNTKNTVLHMQTGDAYPLQMVWTRGSEAGFQFVEEVDLGQFMAEGWPLPKRPSRFDLDFPAKICMLDKEMDATLLNFSQQGAALECNSGLAIGQSVCIDSPLLPDISAVVRWHRNDVYGFLFEDIFHLEDFAHLIEDLRVNIRT